jgi:hypothetical protein
VWTLFELVKVFSSFQTGVVVDECDGKLQEKPTSCWVLTLLAAYRPEAVAVLERSRTGKLVVLLFSLREPCRRGDDGGVDLARTVGRDSTRDSEARAWVREPTVTLAISYDWKALLLLLFRRFSSSKRVV